MAFENQDSVQLVTPAQVIARMGLDASQTGYNEVMLSAIAASQLHVEAVWQSRFTDPGNTAEPAGVTEIFFLDEYEFGKNPQGFFRCMLSRGFINDRVPTTVLLGQSWFDIANGTSMCQNLTAGLEQDASLYQLDPVRGILTVPQAFGVNLSPFPPFGRAGTAWTNAQKWVSITYSSGFDSSTLSQCPDWVQEAIIAYTPVIFDIGQPTNRSAEAEKQFKKAGDHAKMILAPYNRNPGFCFSAVYKNF